MQTRKGDLDLDTTFKKQAAALSGRIGFIFLIASGLLVFVAYFVLSQSFQSLLTDYSIKLIQSMVDQGVTTVEYELQSSKEEVSLLAQSIQPPMEQDQKLDISSAILQEDVIRVIFVTKNYTVSTDKSKIDIIDRQDVKDAYQGNVSMYGPYFNDANEFMICYTAPVKQDGTIVGVLTIEKDAYKFCDIIKDIRFINSGESYIINSEGTDIAVSNLDHINWVTEQYNAQKLLEEEKTEETLSILELEKNGLAGKRGIGTYEWDNGLCYLAYAPIPSVDWVLLAGLRQDEINTMTQTVLFNSITQGPALTISVIIFLILTGVILYWIISSMRKHVEINEKLNMIANYDALTGTLNRNSYHERIDLLSKQEDPSLACIYIDVNGLHEINNHLGHQAGDIMLQAVADALMNLFTKKDVYRIGGDEFVVLCHELDEQNITDKLKVIRNDLKTKGYEISIGVSLYQKHVDLNTLINQAEEAMQQDKLHYYQMNGKERQMRELNQKLEQMVMEKKDADTFLSIIAPEFKGVYFVDLGSDHIRHLNIPPYFEQMLKESNDIFSKALLLYNQHFVKSEYQQEFINFCDYRNIEDQMSIQPSVEFVYQKTDGAGMELRVLKFKTYTPQRKETLWIFSSINERG